MIETNFSEQNKIWGTQKALEWQLPRMLPVSAGLGSNFAESLPLRAFMFVQGG